MTNKETKEEIKKPMRAFYLYRKEDETGISGTGVVAEGVQFSNGICVMGWRTKYTSVAVYTSIDELKAIHGHNGRTLVLWDEYDLININTDEVLVQEVGTGFTSIQTGIWHGIDTDREGKEFVSPTEYLKKKYNNYHNAN